MCQTPSFSVDKQIAGNKLLQNYYYLRRGGNVISVAVCVCVRAWVCLSVGVCLQNIPMNGF